MTDAVERRATFAWLVIAGLCAVAAVLALRASWQTPDALAYMMSAATGQEMYHPHHLLYVPIVRLMFDALRALGVVADAVLAAQVHNTLLGVAASITTFFIVRRWGGSLGAGVLAALALLASRGFWAYSTQADVYVPATACLAGVTLLLPRPGEAAVGWKTLGITVLLALGTLYHQTNILLIVPVAYWYGSLRGRKAWQALGLVLIGTCVLVGGSYVLAYLFTDAQAAMAGRGAPEATGFVQGFMRYCLMYSYHPNPEWGTFRNVSLLGIGRLIHSQAWNVVAFREHSKYLATGLASALLAGLLAWHTWRIWRGRAWRRERTFLLLWLATYGAFFLWWLPSEREFFITPLLPLVLVSWMAIRDWSVSLAGKAKWIAGLAVLAVGGIVIANLSGAIVPDHRQRGAAFEEAADIARLAPKDCVIYNTQAVIQNLRYHFGFTNVQEIDLPLLLALKGRPIPPRFSSDGAPCVLVPSNYLRPDHAIDQLSGYGNPAGYLVFLQWVLGAQAESSGVSVEHRNYEIAGNAGRSPYLRFDSTRVKIGSFEELLGRVDTDALGARTRGSGPLESWWDSTHGGK